MSGFIVTAALLAAAAMALVAWPLLRATAARSAPQRLSALIAALVIGATAAVVYPLLSPASGRANTPVAAGQGGSISELILATLQHPDDVPAWLELGRGYLSVNQWGLARRSYRRADELSGGHSAPALAGLAQTIMFENNGVENDAAIALFERALQIDPQSPQSLFYTAVALMHSGALEKSREQFMALLALNPPPQVSDAIRKQIAGLDVDIAASQLAAKSNAATAIHLQITLATSVAGRVPGGAPLFVFVRSPQGGPPLAVKRLKASFPLQIDLSAADSVLAGNTIARGQRVQVVARISASGNPTAGPGDVYGQIDAIAGDAAMRSLVIDR